jgi:hypothetical protein
MLFLTVYVKSIIQFFFFVPQNLKSIIAFDNSFLSFSGKKAIFRIRKATFFRHFVFFQIFDQKSSTNFFEKKSEKKASGFFKKSDFVKHLM